jgi:uncharacterized protein Yka (UPF0111/DUF47 family)
MRHPHEADLLKFCERQDQSADYVRRTAEWIKKEFPASATAMLPKLRAIYKRKTKDRGA